MTLYNLTKANVSIQLITTIQKNLALLLWNKGKAKTLESGIKKAKNKKLCKMIIFNYIIYFSGKNN